MDSETGVGNRMESSFFGAIGEKLGAATQKERVLAILEHLAESHSTALMPMQGSNPVTGP